MLSFGAFTFVSLSMAIVNLYSAESCSSKHLAGYPSAETPSPFSAMHTSILTPLMLGSPVLLYLERE